MARKLVAAEEELVSKLMTFASHEGKTFYSFINGIFEDVIKIYEQKLTLDEVSEFYELMKTQRASGDILIPMDSLIYLVEQLPVKERESIEEQWYAWGHWYGAYLSSKFPEDTLDAFERLISLSRGELSEVEIVQGSTVKVRCVASHVPLQYTKLLQSYLEGVIHSFGYETIKREHLKGLIILEFKPKEPSEEFSEKKAQVTP